MVDETIKHGVQQVAQELYWAHGKVTPTLLVDAAKSNDSPAHAGFEWDNRKAGHEYRLIQARGWLRRVDIRVEPTAEPERLIHVPRIIQTEENDDENREGEYQAPSVLIHRPDEFERALDQAQSKLLAAKRAMDELYMAAERTERSSHAAIIAQIGKATEMWASALSAMH